MIFGPASEAGAHPMLTYFSMLQTMVQNYSAPEKERDHHKIICKQFDAMKSLEDDSDFTIR